MRRMACGAPGPIPGPGRERRRALALAGWLATAILGCQFDPTGAASAGSDAGDGIGGGGGAQADAAPRPDARIAPPDAEPEPVVCTPGATTCEGRVLSTCNAAGDGFDAEVPCAFTCEADDHCTLASNVPEPDQLACTAAAPRLAPPADSEVVLGANGVITCSEDCGDGVTTIEPAGSRDQGGGAALRWYCVSELSIPDGVTVTAASQASSIAILVAGDASIAGTLSVDGAAGTPTTAGAGGPGGAAGADLASDDGLTGGGPCGGQGGQSEGGLGSSAGGGGAGAGYGSGGAAGGDGRTPGGGQTAAGGTPVGNCGEEDLDPLVGGSGGGSGGDGSCGDCGWPGGGAGGAIQIAAAGTLTVTGAIRAAGGDGASNGNNDGERGGGGGGGSGGGILLEASAISVDAASLVVEGGDGALSGAGTGGAGARADQGAGEGADATANGQGGGGGGGGGGRVRLNASAAPECAGAASPAAACTAAGLRQAGAIAGGQSAAR